MWTELTARRCAVAVFPHPRGPRGAPHQRERAPHQARHRRRGGGRNVPRCCSFTTWGPRRAGDADALPVVNLGGSKSSIRMKLSRRFVEIGVVDSCGRVVGVEWRCTSGRRRRRRHLTSTGLVTEVAMRMPLPGEFRLHDRVPASRGHVPQSECGYGHRSRRAQAVAPCRCRPPERPSDASDALLRSAGRRPRRW